MLRGEVWRMELGRGSREVILLSSDSLAVLPLRVVVPFVEWKDEFTSVPWLVRVPPVLNSGLESVKAADTLQVRSVSTVRLKTRLGALPDSMVDQVAAAVGVVIQSLNA